MHLDRKSHPQFVDTRPLTASVPLIASRPFPHFNKNSQRLSPRTKLPSSQPRFHLRNHIFVPASTFSSQRPQYQHHNICGIKQHADQQPGNACHLGRRGPRISLRRPYRGDGRGWWLVQQPQRHHCEGDDRSRSHLHMGGHPVREQCFSPPTWSAFSAMPSSHNLATPVHEQNKYPTLVRFFYSFPPQARPNTTFPHKTATPELKTLRRRTTTTPTRDHGACMDRGEAGRPGLVLF
jgi:hypothetical protein